MATFFVKFKVAPVPGSKQDEFVEGAYALCWVVETSPAAAFNNARFYVTKGDWEITDDSEPPAEVTEEACQEWDLASENYRKAQDQGIALVYSGWSRDGKTTAGPMPLPDPDRFDLNEYIETQKKLTNKGRCLHFDSDERCKEIISAHSIQKSGQLAAIARDGHVYAGSANMGDLKKNDGRISIQKRGIGKMSTFLGFCKKHDNEVFAPIDTQPLVPTDEQVLLYAYRSVCREFFVKENALDLVNTQLANWPEGHPFTHFEDLKAGTTRALTDLRRHKTDFETSLKARTVSDVEYTLFVAKQKPTLAFSGLIYPHFDFLGRQLQALEDLSASLDLITFCSAPMHEGWGFLFAWHRSSARTCREFVGSLAQTICDGKSGADAAFRLVISNCENLAIAPDWWEGLAEAKKMEISERINHGADTFTPIDSGYLAKGLEGISGWEFESVVTNVSCKTPDDAS